MDRDYSVLCTLGEGSFGKVYKAEHRKTGEVVAVKQIKLGSKSWEEALRSTELQALKTLRHAFIVRLRELLRSPKDGNLFFVFEFIDSDLCKVLKKYPQGLAESRAADLTRQLLAGLAHMHQHNFFHRDIKPENILFDTSSETLRIADFGTCRSVRARPPFTEYVGTRWYRAPECLLRHGVYSTPVDVWAAGLIFAELIRGSPVFMGTSSIDQMYKIVTVLGQPTDWPEFARLAQAMRFRPPDGSGCGLRRVLPNASSPTLALLAEAVAVNPRRRPLARKCLEHPCFAHLPPVSVERGSERSSGQDSPAVSDNPFSELGDDQASRPPSAQAAVDRPPQSGSDSAHGPRSDCAPSVGQTPRVPVEDCSDDDGIDLDAMLDDVLGDDVEVNPRPIAVDSAITARNNMSSTELISQLASSQPHASSDTALLQPAEFDFRPIERSASPADPIVHGSGARAHNAPGSSSQQMLEKTGCLDDLLDGLLGDVSSEHHKPDVLKRVQGPSKIADSPDSWDISIREDAFESSGGFEDLPKPSDLGATGLSISLKSMRTSLGQGRDAPAILEDRSAQPSGVKSLPLTSEVESVQDINMRTAMLPEGLGKHEQNLRTALLSEKSDTNSAYGSGLAEVTLERPSSGRRLLRPREDSFANKLSGDRQRRPAPVRSDSFTDPSLPVQSVSTGPGKPMDDDNRGIEELSRAAADTPELMSKVLESPSPSPEDQQKVMRPFSQEEALKLRRIVKRVYKGGTREKEALWDEVAAELGGDHTAQECKMQYARDYKDHKAKKNQKE